MVGWEVADVANLRAGALERWGRLLLVVAVRRNSYTSDGGGSGLGGKPDNHVLPIVAVAETGRGRVLGHVPAVHDSELTILGSGAGVHLAR